MTLSIELVRSKISRIPIGSCEGLLVTGPPRTLFEPSIVVLVPGPDEPYKIRSVGQGRLSNIGGGSCCDDEQKGSVGWG